MRKIKTIATCMLLGTAMALSSLTTAGATDVTPAVTEELPDGTLMIYGEEVTIEGTFSLRHSSRKTVQKTRFRVDETARIYLESDPDTTCDVKVRFKDENGILKEFLLKPGENNSAYLLAGTYDMELSYSAGESGGVSSNVKPYKISFLKLYGRGDDVEKFGETVDSQDDKMANAHKIGLGKIVAGIFALNESKVDIYQFHSYYDDYPLTFALSSGLEVGDGLAWYVYTPEALECLENGDSSGAVFSAAGMLNSPIEGVNGFTIEEMILPKGTYYLVLSAPSDGYYLFSIFHELSDVSEKADTIYTTVGAPVTLTQGLDPLQNYSLSWEASDPSVVRVDDSAASDTALAVKAGNTDVTGYGTKESSLTGETTLAYVETSVMVEFWDVMHSDEGEDPYYYDPVYWAANHGITEGYKDKNGYFTTFKPQNDCTRSQILTFLWRLKGSPEPVTLTDYPDVKPTDYCYKAVCWAQENGITEGYPDGTFRPQNVCSRSQIVTFLWRMAGKPEPETISSFKDNRDTNAYYYKAVNWAAENEITTGYPNGTFKPMNKCTRGQAVTFLYRYCQ